MNRINPIIPTIKVRAMAPINLGLISPRKELNLLKPPNMGRITNRAKAIAARATPKVLSNFK
jgi:hypothetical protein